MEVFVRFTEKVSKYMDVIAGAALVFIMVLTSLDVILRYLGYPIEGAYDMVSLGGAFVIGFALPKTTLERTHVAVDIVVDKLRPRQRTFLNISTKVIVLLFFIALGSYLVRMGASFLRTGDSTLTLALPLYPVAFVLGVCSFLEVMALGADIYKLAFEGGHHE
jgi:TRAP-type C4-dicarboxylate transport system permease small subunit